MRTRPSAIDLFCGAGGLSEGLRQAGYDVIGAVEVDSLACSAYRLNHGGVKLWEMDVTKLTGLAIMRSLCLKPGDLDLLAACPPCEGFSRMRTKNGALGNQDPRNDLIFEVLRMIRSMRPKSVMLENVPGLAKNQRYAAFCKGLESLGYNVKWNILNTADYAVPQRRRRLVLLASRVGELEFAEKAVGYETVRRSIGNLASPERSRDPLHNYLVRRSEKIEDLVRRIPRDGGGRIALGSEDQLPCHKRFKGFWDVTEGWLGTSHLQRLRGVVLVHPRGDSSILPKTGPSRCAKPHCSRRFPKTTVFRWIEDAIWSLRLSVMHFRLSLFGVMQRH